MNTTATTFGPNVTYVTWTFNWNIPPPRRPPDDGLAGACAVLGMPPGLPPDGIRKAFRQRAKETHPDHGGSAEEFRRVQAAYERLAR